MAKPPSINSPYSAKAATSWLLAIVSVVAFIMIYLIPPSSQILFGALEHVRQTGHYPDGLPVRRKYTGVCLFDEMFTGLAGFFSAASDGRDSSTHLFCLWFLPQLCGVLVFTYWEAGKTPALNLVRLPTFFSILAQLITAGVALPLYFIAHIHTMPLMTPQPPADGLARAWSLLLAMVVGYIMPSAALFLSSTSTSLDTKQILAAIWQPFPLYILTLQTAFRYLHGAVSPPKLVRPSSQRYELNDRAALLWLKLAYIISALLSAVAHWAIMFPSVFSSDLSTSFAHIFVPYILHSYLPIKVTPLSLPAYRPTVRLLFQHDWLFMTISAFIFFAWHHISVARMLSPSMTFNRWLAYLTIISVVGGPGAGFAWAANEREEEMFNFQRTLK